MSIDAETLLDELNTVDEPERIEAKRGTETGKAVMKTVVAFMLPDRHLESAARPGGRRFSS